MMVNLIRIFFILTALFAQTAFAQEARIIKLPELQRLLSDSSSRVHVVNFWATWCLECRPEMPMFERLHHEFGAQGLSVVGINAREGATAVRVYAKELGLTFPLILDPRGTINAAYGVIGLPTTFLIGRDGRPVALTIGPREWSGKPARALIQALLAEPPALKATR